jgi:cation:H+ antiporter
MESLMEYSKFVIGIALVLTGSKLFVQTAVKLSSLLGRSRLFIGLTVVAFGTSAPELAIGVFGVVNKNVGIGLGNVIGSNILNILFVLGLAALIRPIMVNRLTIKREIPILLGISIFFSLIALDGKISIFEAILMGTVLIGYLSYMSRVSRTGGDLNVHNKIEFAEMRGSGKTLAAKLSLIALAILLLAAGSHWTVKGAVSIALNLGVSELTIGLTIVALGTSLPEIVTSLMAIHKNEQDLAIGNVIGSCIFNLMAIPAVMTLVKFSPVTFGDDVIFLDLPIMILSVIVCLPVFFSEHRISRQEGLLFLAYYIVYVLMLYLRETAVPILKGPAVILGLLGIPMIMITLIIILSRALKYRHYLKNTRERS